MDEQFAVIRITNIRHQHNLARLWITEVLCLI